MAIHDWLAHARVAFDEVKAATACAFHVEESAVEHSDLTQLEDRILMSATPVAVVAEPEAAQQDAEASLSESESSAEETSTTLSSSNDPAATSEEDLAQLDESTEQGLLTGDDQPTTRELVFVDESADDYEQLIADLSGDRDDGRSFEVFVLDSDRDGIDQISEVLAGYDNLDAVHIVSHGTDGAVKLGNTWLRSGNLDAYAAQLVGWGDALSTEADLLFYGCDLASNEDGKSLIESLSALTDADVAASVDDTGHAILGGDWDLEYTTGSIEAQIAFSTDVQQNWGHLLNVAIDATSTGTSTGGNFSISHTTSGTDRLMLVGVSMDLTGSGTEWVSSMTYNGQSLTLVGVEEAGQARVEIWAMVAPDVGTYNLDIVFNSPTDGNTAGVMTFTGVDQATPLGTFASDFGYAESVASATVASAADEMVFGVVAIDDPNFRVLTEGAGQTEAWELDGYQITGAGSIADGAASVNMSWTWSQVDDWAAGGVSIKASNNEEVLATNTGTTISEGSTANVITTAMLETTDADHAASQLTYTITTATGNGTLRLSGTALGVNDTFRQADIDAGNVTYDHNGSETASDSFSFNVDDGVGTTSSGTFNVTVTAVNDDPTNAGSLPADVTVIEDVPTNVDLSAIDFSDVDAAPGNLTITLSTSTGGQLTAAAGTGITIGGTPTVRTLSGSLTDLNNYFNDTSKLTYVHGTPHTFGDNADTIQVVINDNGNTGSGGGTDQNLGTVNVDITAVNDAPVNTVPGAQSATEDTPLALGSISVADDDDNLSTVQLTAINGTLNVTLNGSASISAGANGSNDLTLSGLLADINATLTSLSYQGNLNYNGSDTLTVLSTDANSATDSDTVAITIDAVNDAPVITYPQGPSTSINTAIVFSGAGGNPILISDVDAGGSVIELSLTAGDGSITLGSLSGLTFSVGDGTSDVSMTFTGTISDINTALDGLNFTPDAFFSGIASLAVMADDLGNNPGAAMSGNATIGISVGASQSLWFSTEKNVSGSGIGELPNWEEGQIIRISDPDLVFESGTSGGTFTSVFNLDNFTSSANINAMHRVTGDITIGTGTTFDLLAGDILFSTKDGETLTGNNTLSIGKEDVVVFRPDTLGNYSSGSFYMLFDNPLGAEIRGISLVEQDALVGDTTLTAGSFLFSRSGGSEDQRIYLYDPVDTGTTPAGTTSVLIEGTDIGIDAQVWGIELVEEGITIAGRMFSAGEILLTLDGGDTVGSNSLSVNARDVFALDLTQTTLGSGTAVATATLVFEGADAGLDSGDEDLDALALVIINEPPEVTTTVGSVSYTENDGAVGIDSSLTLSDDSNTITGATISITSGFRSGEDVLAFTDQLGITGSYNSGTGVLSLSGIATVADYQTALRSITYENTSDNPSTTVRTISFVANDEYDSSQPATRNITISSVNDDPTNAGSLPTNVTVTEDVATNVDLSAIDFNDLDASVGSLTITLSTSTGGQLTAAAGTGITIGGTPTARTLTGSLTDLNNYFNDPTKLSYLHGTPHNFGDNADTIQVVINDNGNAGSGGGTNQNLGTVNVDITAVNDAPAVGTNTNATVLEGGTVTITTAMLNEADVDDSGAGLTYTVTGGPTNGQLEWTTGPGVAISSFTQDDIDLGRVIFVHDGTQASSDSFDFSLADGGEDGATAGTGTFNFTVTNVNDAPVASNIEGTDLAYTENDGAVAVTSMITFIDVDDANIESAIVQISGGYNAGEDVLSFSNQNGITGAYNATTATWTLTGSATLADYETAIRSITYTNTSEIPDTTTRTVSFTVNDGDANSNTLSRNLTISSVNDAPTNAGSLPTDVSVTEDVATNVDLSAIDFSDLDASGGNLTVTLSTSTGGQLTAAAGTGVTIGGTTTVRTFTGSLTDLNNYFNDPTKLSYLHGTPHTFGDNADTIQVVINDNGNTGSGGGTDQNLGAVNVDITAVNDAPTVGTNTGATVLESGAVSITTAMLNEADVDDSGTGLTYTVTGGPTNGQLEWTTGPGVAISWFTQDDIDSGRVIFVHDGTQASSDSFDFSLADGGEDGATLATGTFNFSITNVNDAPVAGTVEGTDLAYTENDGAVAVTSTITFSDVDDTNTESAIVQISGGYNADEDVLSFSNQNGITGVYNATTATWTLTGSATLADYETAIRSIAYTNTSENPDTTTRTVSFTVNDGDANSNTLSRNLTISAVNDAPVQSAIEIAPLGYTENDGAVAVTSTLSISDVDDANIESAVIQLTGGYVNGQDVLAFTNTANVAGSWDGVTGTLSLTGTDTLANYESALRSMTYENTSDAPSAATRTVSFTVNDGDTNSSTMTRDITVTPVNDEEVLSTNAGTTVDEASTGNVITTAMLETTDVDNTGQLIYTVTAATGNGTLRLSGTALGVSDTFTQADIDAGWVTYDHNGSETLSDAFDFSVDDGFGTTSSGTFNVTVTPVNDVPVGTDDTYTVDNDSTLDVVAPGVLLNDVDSEGDTLSVSLVSGPNHGTFSLTDDGAFTYTPTFGSTETDSFVYVISDGTDVSAPVTVVIIMNDVLGSTTSPPDVKTVDPEDSSDDVAEDNAAPIVSSPNLTGSEEVDGRSQTVRRSDPSKLLREGGQLASSSDLGEQAVLDTASRAFDSPDYVRSIMTLSNELRDSEYSSVSFVFEAGSLFHHFDSVIDDLENHNYSSELMAGTTIVASGAVSVGFVAWAARASYFATMLSSSLPAWAMIDAVPVLDSEALAKRSEKRLGRRQDKSLADIVIEKQVSVSVQLLDEHFAEQGTTLQATTRDISDNGIGLVCGEPIEAEHIRIRLTTPSGDEMDVLGNVRHCSGDGKKYHVGVNIVADWTPSAAT